MKSQETTKKGRVISFLPDGDYYFEKGITAYQRGDLQKAKKFVERAIVFNPNGVDYLCQLAAILAELEQFDASNRLLKKVVFEIDPSQVECFFFMANNSAYMGRYEEALRDVKRYMSLEPNGSFFEEARDLYKLLIFESGTELLEDSEAYISDHEKGRQALEHGEFQKAIYYFQKVIKERPSFWAAQNNLAIAHFSNGQYEQGLDRLDQILEQDPGNVHALCNKVTFYHQLGDQKVVEELIPLLDVLYPLYPENRSKLGATYFFLGQYEKAYHWLTSAERTGMFDDQSFYYWLAVTCYRLGKEKKALKAWNQVDFFSETPFQPFEYGKLKELIKEEDAKENPLVRSLVEHELKEGQLEAKLLSLFYLHDFADGAAQALLKESNGNADLPSGVREIARDLLQRIQGDGSNQDPRIVSLLMLQGRLGYGKPLIEDLHLYQWWFTLYTHFEWKMADVQSWSAAIEYRYRQHSKVKVTQQEICEQYGISIYKLRRHLSLIEDFDIQN